MLRVGHVTLGLDVGGQEKMLVEFARRADRRRFVLHFISLGGRGSLAPVLEEFGWQVTTLETPSGLRPGLIFRLAKVCRDLGLDVLHTHDDRPLLYGSLARRLARLNVHVHTQHHGELASVSARQAFFIRWAARLTDRFVCVSQDSARYMVKQGVPAAKVNTIWNGIDLDRFAFHGFCPGGPIVTVARLSPEKGIDVLLRAMVEVVRHEPGARLEIAGDGPLRVDLEKLADELKLRGNVRFLGEVRDIPPLLAKASLFVLPSHSEGISLTLLEAMASGLPVVTTKVGGNSEVVMDRETGLLVPAADAGSLAAAICQVFQNAEKSQLMGRAGRHRVEAFFDIRQVVSHYEGLYEKINSPSASAAGTIVK